MVFRLPRFFFDCRLVMRDCLIECSTGAAGRSRHAEGIRRLSVDRDRLSNIGLRPVQVVQLEVTKPEQQIQPPISWILSYERRDALNRFRRPALNGVEIEHGAESRQKRTIT